MRIAAVLVAGIATILVVAIQRGGRDRAGAVRYFLAAVLGAPRAFVAAMPLLMPRTWARAAANDTILRP